MFVFDATSSVSECLVFVVRYMEGWEIRQKCARLAILANNLNADELTFEISATFLSLKIDRSKVLLRIALV